MARPAPGQHPGRRFDTRPRRFSTIIDISTTEFATSVGVSTIYFAAAVRANGGGTVIGSEIVPDKAATARRNLADAGLADLVDLRIGDARQTLRDLGGPVDFALIDGWPGPGTPTLARQVIDVVAPQLRLGALVMNDNAEADYLDYIRNPANGFRSLSLPLEGATELSIKVRSDQEIETARSGQERTASRAASSDEPGTVSATGDE